MFIIDNIYGEELRLHLNAINIPSRFRRYITHGRVYNSEPNEYPAYRFITVILKNCPVIKPKKKISHKIRINGFSLEELENKFTKDASFVCLSDKCYEVTYFTDNPNYKDELKLHNDNVLLWHETKDWLNQNQQKLVT